MSDRRRPDFATFVRLAWLLRSSLDLYVVLGEILSGLDRLLQPTNWSLLLGEDAGNALVLRLVSAEGQVLGVIELVNELDEREFSGEDFRILEAHADFAAIAIRNAKAHGIFLESSGNDPLSGLRNSRYFPSCVEGAVRRGKRFALAFFDLDRFKTLVDEHGHLSGSEVLAEVGEVLRETLTAEEIGCRFGGDEAAFLPPEADGPPAASRSAELAATIRGRVFLEDRGIAARLDVSFGWVALPTDAQEADALLRLADTRMYEAKRSSRRGREVSS
ncbi:MAG: sensor domain-containing diguanylate cyclase [Candidatus Binatia bacterium]|nr:sensor domain-containing diguanylate cyclase [Candidatus Binatia bacterium]